MSTYPQVSKYILDKYDRSTHTYVNGDFTVAVATSVERPTYPFPGNNKHYLLEQDYMQYIDYYMDTLPSIGSPHPKYPQLYFIEDSPISDVGGGVGRWTRKWGFLPGFDGDFVSGSFVRKESESYTWTKPGVKTTAVDDGQYIYWMVDNDASTLSGDGTQVTLVTKVNLATGQRYQHNLSNYDTAYVIYDIYSTNRNQPFQYAYQPAIVSQTTSSITVASVPYDDASSYPIQYLSFSKPLIQIEPTQRTINTVLYYDYWVEGLNVDNIENIPLIQEWRVLDANGNQTDVLSDDTDPTRSEYNAMVAAGTKVCMGSSVIRRWAGAIWERETRFGILV